MTNRLTPLPTADDHVWYLQCQYCQKSDTPNKNLHELELIAKAKKFCLHYRTNHFLDFLQSSFDTVNHGILTPITMIEILTQIHDQLGCTCLDPLTNTIQDLTKSDHNITIPTPYQPPTNAQSRPQKSGKTLLERLQNGKNGTHK